MTEQVDLDALEALATKQAVAYRRMLEIGEGVGGLGVRHPAMFEDGLAWDESTVNGHADTVLALIAELRQERERADRLEANRRLWIRDAFEESGKASAALSRAEETIDRFRTLEPLWHRGMYGCPQDMYGANQIRTILTEHDKQKGQADD